MQILSTHDVLGHLSAIVCTVKSKLFVVGTVSHCE